MNEERAHDHEAAGVPLPDHTRREARVLVVGIEGDDARALSDAQADIHFASDDEAAWAGLADDTFDALVIGPAMKRSNAIELARKLTDSDLCAGPIFVLPRPTVAFSVDAMRSGAVDLIRLPFEADDVARALDRARERTETARSNKRRVERLKKICQRLHASRDDANRQVDVLCSDLAEAYQEMSRKMPQQATPNSNYHRSIASELDVESLLRTTLEHVLSKTGPTNAAVYLPTGSGDFALGAYVNYSLASESADVALDHMADCLAPRFADEDDMLVFDGPGELAEQIDGVGSWIGDAGAVVFACRNEGETLAVGTLFRDASEPFTIDALDEIDEIRADFAAQLSKIINIHNRHKPTENWPGFEVDERADDESDWGADDYGLAA